MNCYAGKTTYRTCCAEATCVEADQKTQHTEQVELLNLLRVIYLEAVAGRKVCAVLKTVMLAVSCVSKTLPALQRGAGTSLSGIWTHRHVRPQHAVNDRRASTVMMFSRSNSDIALLKKVALEAAETGARVSGCQ